MTQASAALKFPGHDLQGYDLQDSSAGHAASVFDTTDIDLWIEPGQAAGSTTAPTLVLRSVPNTAFNTGQTRIADDS